MFSFFYSFQLYLRAYSFLIFLGIVVVFLILVYAKLPETKDKTYEEISRLFNIQETPDRPAIDMVDLCENDIPSNLDAVWENSSLVPRGFRLSLEWSERI